MKIDSNFILLAYITCTRSISGKISELFNCLISMNIF